MNKNNNNNKIQNPFIFPSYGKIYGVLTKNVVARIERVKLLYQTPGYYSTTKYLVASQPIIKILKNDGIKGLYYGNCKNIIRIFPTYSLKFIFNDIYKSLFIKDQKKVNISFKHLFFTGMFSGLSQSTITYPLETIKKRMLIDNVISKNNTVLKCIKNTLKKNGIKGFYQGYIITIVSKPLYVGLQMSLYDIFRNKLNNSNHINDKSYIKKNSPILSMFAGASAGFIAQISTYWLIVIKKHMKLNMVNRKNKTLNYFRCIQNIYINKGIKGFYIGIIMDSVKRIPEVALQFTFYDICKKKLLYI